MATQEHAHSAHAQGGNQLWRIHTCMSRSVVVSARVSALLFCPAACWTATAGTTQRSEAILLPTSREFGLHCSSWGTTAGAGVAMTVTAADGGGPSIVWVPFGSLVSMCPLYKLLFG